MDLNSRPVQLVRMAAASLALEWVRPKHRIAQIVYVVLAALAIWQGWWWLLVLAALFSLVTFLVYRALVRLIRFVGMPKNVRTTLGGMQDQIRAEFESIGIPTGPVGAGLFAWNLARGKRPHAELLARIPVAAANVQRLVQDVVGPPGPTATP
jgi:hypothetical protein